MSGDLKEGRNDVKAPLNLVPMWALYGCARVCRFGDNRYSPGNWKHAAADRERAFADYVDALLRHWSDMQEHGWDSVAPDSGLPHIDHLITNAMFIRGLMQLAGTLPRDPGRGNEPEVATTLPSDLVGKRVKTTMGCEAAGVCSEPDWACFYEDERHTVRRVDGDKVYMVTELTDKPFPRSAIAEVE